MRVINGILLALMVILVITIIVIIIIASVVGKQIATRENEGRVGNSSPPTRLTGGVILIQQNGKIILPKSTMDQFVIVTAEGPVEISIPPSGVKREITITKKNDRREGEGDIRVVGEKGVTIRGSSIIESGTAIFRSGGSNMLEPRGLIQESFIRIQ